MSRVTRLMHKGMSILHVDLKDLKPGEFRPVIDEAIQQLRAFPPRSQRVVTDVDGARFDPPTIGEFERFVREGTPYCVANAVVGVTGIRRVAWLGLKPFYKCPSALHDSVDAAKDWLVAFKE
jgi:hypothetical protein